MKTSTWWAIVVFLLLVIVVLTWLLVVTPAPGTATGSTSSPQAGTAGTATGTATGGTEPLSKKVIVTSPKANTTVGQRFVVAGSAPGGWYFEASFPIKVIDNDGNIIASTIGQAQGEWMTSDPVTFTAMASTSILYTGPATVVLMRDNPSGLPENDDSVSVPVVIQ